MEGNIKEVLAYWMEGEISNFIKVWLSAYLSLVYCYFAARTLPAGRHRLAAFLPVVFLFLLLPLRLSSMHLTGTTAFFLSWLANFKLLMLAAGNGPLSDDPSLSLPQFVAVACLPIKLRPKNPKSGENFGDKGKSIFNYAAKALLLALIFQIYDYGEYIRPKVLMAIQSLHVYLSLELTLAVAAALARGLVGAELEPQFDEPYLSASLQDFWGRRWNLMATRALRPTVYLPTLGWAGRAVGRRWAPLPAVAATFLVSGLLHELIFYYLCRARPTWEVTWFFVLHGACLAGEIAVKKAAGGRWRPPRAVATPLTVGFVMGTGFRLFFPPLLRGGAYERGLAEVAAVGAFARDLVRAVKLMVSS
ncbi:MBOAT (membrane bound O-acyl transferase) family protein [Striga asiatica]|uniref:MBOAT (Membrane bound O-acyl transferase) family protein n=1 Tax=Striga asiatica TaxID=4170 RepID=A0A5A7R981_STRAF|nr:MBOAT (membrane bound O-acyl transferase) family protein [Striga asiatica]